MNRLFAIARVMDELELIRNNRVLLRSLPGYWWGGIEVGECDWLWELHILLFDDVARAQARDSGRAAARLTTGTVGSARLLGAPNRLPLRPKEEAL